MPIRAGIFFEMFPFCILFEVSMIQISFSAFFLSLLFVFFFSLIALLVVPFHSNI